MAKILTLLLLIPTFACTQKVITTEGSGPTNIYNDALKRYLILTSQQKKSMFDTLFVQKDEVVTDSLMATIKGSKVIIVDSSILHDHLRQSGSFTLHNLYRINFHKGVFYVGLVPFNVTEDNGEIYFTNTGTFKIEYLFDARMKAFQFKRGKSYGY